MILMPCVIQIQSSDDYKTKCEGIIAQCLVGQGAYQFFDLTNNVFREPIVVGEMLLDADSRHWIHCKTYFADTKKCPGRFSRYC